MLIGDGNRVRHDNFWGSDYKQKCSFISCSCCVIIADPRLVYFYKSKPFNCIRVQVDKSLELNEKQKLTCSCHIYWLVQTLLLHAGSLIGTHQAWSFRNKCFAEPHQCRESQNKWSLNGFSWLSNHQESPSNMFHHLQDLIIRALRRHLRMNPLTTNYLQDRTLSPK